MVTGALMMRCIAMFGRASPELGRRTSPPPRPLTDLGTESILVMIDIGKAEMQGMARGEEGLFDDYTNPRASFRTAVRAWVISARRAVRSFPVCVAISGFFHLAVICLFLISGSPRVFSVRGDDILSDSLKSFRKAAVLADEESTGSVRFSDFSDEAILALLSGMPVLDSRFTKNERTNIILNFLQILKMESLTDAAAGLSEESWLSNLSDEEILALLSSKPGLDRETADREGKEKDPEGKAGGVTTSMPIGRTRIVDSGPFASGGPALYKIAPSLTRRLAVLRRQEKYERAAKEVRGGYVRVEGTAGIRDIPSAYFFRDCPYEEILAVGAGLFYFVTGFPDFLPAGLVPQETTPRRPMPEERRAVPFQVVLIEAEAWSRPSLRREETEILEHLTMSADERQAVLDEFMTLPEEEQFARFAHDYLERFDPDQEDLALLAREFIYGNQSAVFVVASRFSAAFDFLEKLYFNKRVQGYLEDYWRKNCDTRTGREILSVLAGLVDFEKRTLEYLFDAYERAVDVLSGREPGSEVFNPGAKAFVIVKTLEAVMEAMVRAGIRSQDNLLALYEDREIALLNLLADSGGMTRNDTLFSLGCLHWSGGRFGKAVEAWRIIDSSYGRGAFRDMMELIRKSESGPGSEDEDYALIGSEIDEMIACSFGSSSKRQLERMVRFNTWSLRYQYPSRE